VRRKSRDKGEGEPNIALEDKGKFRIEGAVLFSEHCRRKFSLAWAASISPDANPEEVFPRAEGAYL
jgi:hypothetical protein